MTVEHHAKDKVDNIASQQQDKLRQHNEIITALGADKSALENRIKRLRVFEDDYRTRLLRFLHAQLQQLDAHKPARPANPINTQRTPVATGSDGHPETSRPWSCLEKRGGHLRWAPKTAPQEEFSAASPKD